MSLRLPKGMRRSQVLRAVLAGGSILGLSGCGSMGADGSMAAAQIRFLELAPGAPEMDFYVNGTGAAYTVGYANYTSYLAVAQGPVSISANRAGTGQTLGTVQGVLTGGRQYTAVVSHRLGSLQTHLYEDQDAPAAAGQIAVRVLDEIDGPGPLTVYIAPSGSASGAAVPMVLSVAGGGASAYVTLPANASYTVNATVGEAGLRVPVSSVTVKAAAGSVRTVVFGGAAAAGGHGAVGFALEDADALQAP